jgi:two-component system sensor histidine kinase/response regulator
MARDRGAIPCMNASLRPAGPKAAEAELRADPTVRVLVVDDNPSKRAALAAVLLPLGYSIVEADSGLAALRCIMGQDFAVILLDVRMPIMDGIETASLIRKRRQSEMTPIIFITAHVNDEIGEADRYAQGAVDFIFAPVAPDELRAKVSVFANLFIKAEGLATRARDLQASADQLRLLTDAAPIGIFQTDAQNRFVYTNPRWTEITGIPPEEAVGREWGATIGAKTREGVSVELADTDVDPTEPSQRVEISIPGSAPRIVVATSKAIPDGAGGIAGWVGTLADVTAEAGTEAALSDARDKATEASRLKSDFLANMSHEIRTPMNGVIGMTDLLLETDLDVRQREYAQTVRNSGEALLTIINDILDFSKVEAGKLEIEDIEFNVRTVVDDVVDLLAGPAQTKGLELVAVIEGSVPDVVSGDPGRVRQVLTNLIGNAIKFTQSGEIVVRVTEADVVGADASPEGWCVRFECATRCTANVVRFEVSDTGDGIEPDKLDLVFQPFVQADTSTSRKYGGTGLGLAISSQLVALMGGDCGVWSRPGVGSNFWFTICVHADPGQAMGGVVSPDVGLAGVPVLIVDDNAVQRSVLSEYMTDWGMTVSTADSGEVALATMRNAAAERRPFTVAIIDRSMPGMDGLALKDAILADPALKVRLVLITGLRKERDLGDAAAAGVSASLSKPVHREDLRASLLVALGLREADVAPIEELAQRPSSSGHTEAGRLLLAEDNLINQKVAVAMLSSAGYRVDTVLNGREAVQAAVTQRYDAILMDCQMPEMNGYEATAAIRAQEVSGRHTPIIAMTAGARREDRERCLAEGMDSYLAKPFSKDALLALVSRSMKDGPASIVPFPRIDLGPVPEVTIDPAILDELRDLGEDSDHDLLTEVIDQFVRDTEPLLVQLREALDVGDAPAVGRIAHSIKGSCGQLGGLRLALSCGRLEGKAIANVLSDGQDDLLEVEIDYQELRRTLMAQPSRVDRQRSGSLRA